MSTLYVYVPAVAHTKAGHPENHHRLADLLAVLHPFNVLGELTVIISKPASMAQLLRVHTKGLVEQVRQVSRRGGGLLDRGDTYATESSYELARLAVGACCTAVDHIMSGAFRNGLALVRPPGHHAGRDRVSGFCLFNNIAAAARHAQKAHGVKRALIVDFDVHHGNGTQDIFYDDDSVLFASLHMFAPYFYPGIGGSHEMGAGRGRGYTVNVPFPPFVGDAGYLHALDALLKPKVDEFQPELILASVGFDAHWQDPLAQAGLSLTGYAQVARRLIEMADRWCDGRILFVLEGGYKQDILTLGILNLIYALTGQDEINDALGPMPYAEQDVTEIIRQLRQRHLLK